VDRNNAQVAELYQEFHPAVLQALNQVVEAAHSERKGVAICGEMAGNPSAAVLLMAMGFDVLSMTSASLLLVKHALTNFDMSHAQEVLANVLEMDNAYLIRNYVDDEMRKAGLGKIVRSRRYSKT
jgi:phosphotransferase system enzyme I (PtsP)